MYAIGVAPAAERDIERIHTELRARAKEGKVRDAFPDEWFEASARKDESLKGGLEGP